MTHVNNIYNFYYFSFFVVCQMCPVKKPCGPVDLRLILGYREMELRPC